MAAIQKYVVKQSKRNPISRRFHAKEDNQAIASWRLDLDEIRHIIAVRSFNPAGQLLTLCFFLQTEFANGTDTGVTEIRRGITNAHSTVRDAHTDIPNSSIAIPEVRCDVSQTVVPGPCSSAIDSHPIAFGVQAHDRADVHTVDPCIRREGRKNTCTDSQHRAVSTSRTLLTDLDSYNRLALRQVRN